MFLLDCFKQRILSFIVILLSFRPQNYYTPQTSGLSQYVFFLIIILMLILVSLLFGLFLLPTPRILVLLLSLLMFSNLYHKKTNHQQDYKTYAKYRNELKGACKKAIAEYEISL